MIRDEEALRIYEERDTRKTLEKVSMRLHVGEDRIVRLAAVGSTCILRRSRPKSRLLPDPVLVESGQRWSKVHTVFLIVSFSR